MPVEDVYLAQAARYMLSEKAKAILRAEASKGCTPDIAPHPLALEPFYRPLLGSARRAPEEPEPPWLFEAPPSEDDLVRLRVWISPEQRCDWVSSERFLKELVCLCDRAALEIVGNQEAISIQFLCHKSDALVLRAVFLGEFKECALSVVGEDRLRVVPMAAWESVAFLDYVPDPPYSHLFTTPEELKRSPYSTLMSSMADIQPPAIGIYQVVFAAVSPDHNWHQNVQAMQDLEFNIKLQGGGLPAQRYVQQAPSGDLRHMATDVVDKAHNDKPFFAAALRIAVVAEDGSGGRVLQSLRPTVSLVQHGGHQLGMVTGDEYRSRLSAEAIRGMFLYGLTHRPGFLANSCELTSLVHVPPPEVLEHLKKAIRPLETLPADASLSEGTCIGICEYADVPQRVCIPDTLRFAHCHLIGRPGSGKSTLMEHMFCHDLRSGHGAAVIDPHGTLIERLLCFVPEEHVDRIIYVDPGDPDWVPTWNPVQCRSPFGPHRIADDLVGAFKSFVDGWGDRLEHFLRHAILALSQLPGSSLLDVSDLLRPKSPEGEQLRSIILRTTDSEVVRQFWSHDFQRYKAADIQPPQHKLSKLLTSGTGSLMLSQSDSSFDLGELMDTGKILLVDLSKVGSEVRSILGCFFLSLLYLTALGRRKPPAGQLLPYHIYCDEAHKFLTDAIEDMIAQTRKFRVSLTLAHQYRGQFEQRRKVDALSSVGSTVIFNVNSGDAQYLVKGLQGRVEVDDLIALEVGQAVARIGTHVVRLKTLDPLEVPEANCRELIIQRSRERYCRPAQAVRRAIRRRGERWAAPVISRNGSETPDARHRTGPEEPPPSDGGGAGGAHSHSFDDYDRW